MSPIATVWPRSARCARLVRVARVLHEDAFERIPFLLSEMKGDARIENREASLLRHLGDHIGAHMADQVAQHLEALGDDGDRKPSRERGHEESQEGEGQSEPQRRDPRGAHHDELAVPIQLVERGKRRGEQGDRGDDREQRRERQEVEEEEDENALALAGDQIELAQRLRHPDHGGERKADRQEGGTNRLENVALDEESSAEFIPCASQRRL